MLSETSGSLRIPEHVTRQAHCWRNAGACSTPNLPSTAAAPLCRHFNLYFTKPRPAILTSQSVLLAALTDKAALIECSHRMCKILKWRVAFHHQFEKHPRGRPHIEIITFFNRHNFRLEKNPQEPNDQRIKKKKKYETALEFMQTVIFSRRTTNKRTAFCNI